MEGASEKRIAVPQQAGGEGVNLAVWWLQKRVPRSRRPA